MLEIRDVRVVYPNGLEALKSISLTAERGEIIAIIGRSGAGKSTLLRCINGLQQPSSGSIVLDGEEITTLSEAGLRRARCHIGFIWQDSNLVDRLPVLTNVLAGRLGYNQGASSLLGYFSRAHREVAVRNLERVGLLERAAQRADRLSGGEKQRVAIARAISQEPKIVLADEPVASLDPELSVQVLSDLARVAREDNVLTIINLHQVSLAVEFADRIIGIAQGQVVFNGLPGQLSEDVLNQVYRFDKASSAEAPTEHTHA
ncbi:MAG: phosphonate ABC transporter ATP-binding protein [Chloroflexales bacterium]|nr:phosphonate ABC transporter ATP-binding protein [Chloroflexales bacterium]